MRDNVDGKGHHCYLTQVKGAKRPREPWEPTNIDPDLSGDEGLLQYMEPVRFRPGPTLYPEELPTNLAYICYDFECKIAEDGEHVPNMACALKWCMACEDEEDDEAECGRCKGKRRVIFRGDNCLNDFCEWLFSKENRGATALAHNAGKPSSPSIPPPPPL